jgi:hypothetical protein
MSCPSVHRPALELIDSDDTAIHWPLALDDHETAVALIDDGFPLGLRAGECERPVLGQHERAS